MKEQQRHEEDQALTFRKFQALSALRCVQAFPTCADWSLNDWAVALVGEAGELCNLLKKVRRGDFGAWDRRQELISEIADVLIYADLLMTQLGADTGVEVMRKFDEVSARVGWRCDAVDPHLSARGTDVGPRATEKVLTDRVTP